MAVRDFADWVPMTYDPNVVMRGVQTSAVERVAHRVTMTADAQERPRLLGADVNSGSQLVEDTNDGSKVTLYSHLFNGKHSLDEAQTEDTYASEIDSINRQWLSELNVAYDQAALAVTGGRSTTASDKRPYNSLLHVLLNNDSDAAYTGGANVTTAALTYDNASATLGQLENSDFGNETDLVVIAHRSLRQSMRGIKDNNNNPIFQSADAVVHFDSIFGLPIEWTAGGVVSGSYASRPTANKKLFAVVNRNFITFGDRIAPQARFIPAAINPNALEHTLQHRARRGFVLTVPQAAAALLV